MIWQKIETAPYSETIILGFFYDGETITYGKDGDCFVAIGKLYQRYGKPPMASALANVCGNFINVSLTDCPTHWMPLPAPPEE